MNETQRAKYQELVGRLMLAGRHPDFAIAMEAATSICDLLVQPPTHRVAGNAVLSEAEIALLGNVKKFHTHDFGRGPELHADAIADAYRKGRESASPTTGDGNKPAVVGWLVRGEATYLYVDSPERPDFVFINGSDKVVSIEPRFAAVPPATKGELAVPQKLLDYLSNLILERGICNPEYNEGISDAAHLVKNLNESLYARAAAAASREASGTKGRFFVYDPSGGHIDFYDTDAERDKAHKESIADYRHDAILDGELSHDVESIVSGIVTHTTVEVSGEGEGSDFEAQSASRS
jgi:hypothetical protein